MRRFAVVLLISLAACSASKKDLQSAQHSQYDADFATVYSAALTATRDLYPNLDDNPANGNIKTAWHPVQYASTQDDQQGATPTNNLGGALGAPTTFGQSPASGASGMPMHLATKRFFIRFDVSVVGGRPWRVKVVGHASSWDVGAAMPVELHGIARPAWLSPRVEALQVEIYKRVKKFAVPMKEEEKLAVAEDLPKTDSAQFKDVPAEAGKALAQLKDTLSHRDLTALRPLMADDVVWSLGGAPGVDTAMAMWQADPDSFDAMARLVTGECGKVSQTRVECPGKAQVGQWQLVLESRSGAWKVTSFIKLEQQ